MSNALIKEQWCVINFCVRLGKSVDETFQLLQTAYRTNSLKKSTVYDWYHRFVELRDLHRKETETGETVKKVEQCVEGVNEKTMEAENKPSDGENLTDQQRRTSQTAVQENKREFHAYRRRKRHNLKLRTWSNMLCFKSNDNSVLLKSYKEAFDLPTNYPGKLLNHFDKSFMILV